MYQDAQPFQALAIVLVALGQIVLLSAVHWFRSRADRACVAYIPYDLFYLLLQT